MESFGTYLDMGGYGEFIWSSYGAVMIVIIGLWVLSYRYLQASKSELQSLDTDRPRRQPRQKDET